MCTLHLFFSGPTEPLGVPLHVLLRVLVPYRNTRHSVARRTLQERLVLVAAVSTGLATRSSFPRKLQASSTLWRLMHQLMATRHCVT